MMLLLGSLLVGSSCLLGIRAEITVMPKFVRDKILGYWYPLLSIPIGAERMDHFDPFTFKALRRKNMMYIVRHPVNGTCVTVSIALKQKRQPGDYKTNVPSSLRFVKTDYTNYFISHISMGTTNRKIFLALAGRKRNVTPDLETQFRTVATSLGITGEILRSILKETC